MEILNTNDNFSSDNFEMSSGFIKFGEISTHALPLPAKTKEIRPKAYNEEKILIRVMSQNPANSNPLSLIHDLRPDLKWDFIGSHTKGKVVASFTMMLNIDSRQFIGEGKTKKLAKYEAAKNALSQIYGIQFPTKEFKEPEPSLIPSQESLLLDQNLADKIRNSVLSISEMVFERLNDTKNYNVISSIILTRTDVPSWLDVICITTGTKCIKGDCLSMTGSALHDCHAEILARRCFINYLFKQLKQMAEHNFLDRSENILRLRDDGFGFRIKENFQVHLYISTAPCGDARVFSPKEEMHHDLHPNRISRGVLRAKIEGGEGTIPVKPDKSTLTWDGVVQGTQRVQFMSCSDKIALWNVVGLQGALLSHFIEPIYLQSVILGSLFSYEHLVRAIQGRLNCNSDSNALKNIPMPYHVNLCKVAKASVKECERPRQVTRVPNYAINYIKYDSYPEVISCDSGKVHKEEKSSRLCKKAMFSNFHQLLNCRIPKLPSSMPSITIPTLYREAKTSSIDYQRTKISFIRALNEQNLGDWLQVPAEVDLFYSCSTK